MKKLLIVLLATLFSTTALAQPVIQSISNTDLSTVVVTFNQNVDQTTSETVGNWNLVLTNTGGTDWDWASHGGMNVWAQWDQWISPIDASMKANLRTIYLDGQNAANNGAGLGNTNRPRAIGRMGQIGDSITDSGSYFTPPFRYGGISPNETGHNYGGDTSNIDPTKITDWLDKAWVMAQPGFAKSAAYGSISGQALYQYGNHLRGNNQPWRGVDLGNYSWVLIMIGTNDIKKAQGTGQQRIDEWLYTAGDWEAELANFVQDYIDLDVIPVLSTIPPRSDGGFIGTGVVEECNTRIKNVAESKNIPWVDYYGVILNFQPGTAWLGTLISTDGVHPSLGGQQPGPGRDYRENTIRNLNGYNLRTKLTFDIAEKLRNIVFEDGTPEGTGSQTQVPISSASKTAANKVTLTLTSPTVNSTSHTVTATGVQPDGGGTGSNSSYIFVSLEAPDVIGPTLVNSSSSNINTVSVSFNEDIQNGTGTWTIYQTSMGTPAGDVSITSATATGTQVTIVTADMLNNTEYTVSVIDIEDLAGNTTTASDNFITPVAGGGPPPSGNAPQLVSVFRRTGSSPGINFNKIIDYNQFPATSEPSGNCYRFYRINNDDSITNFQINKTGSTDAGVGVKFWGASINTDGWYVFQVWCDVFDSSGTDELTTLQSKYFSYGSADPTNEPNFAAPADVTAPSIITVTGLQETQFVVTFDEKVKRVSAENIVNWRLFETANIENEINVTNSTYNTVDSNKVTIQLADSLVYSLSYTIRASNVEDLSGNPTIANEFVFTSLNPPVVDVTAPIPQTASKLGNNTVLVTFNESLDRTSAETINNWTVTNKTVTLVTRQVDTRQVVITVNSNWAFSTTYTITANNVKDLNNNATSNVTIQFTTSAAPTGITIPIKVFNSEDIPINKIVTVGIPFRNDGDLTNETNIAVRNAAGNDVGPVGREVAMRWHDANNYPRFVHVSFPVSISANTNATYYITTEVTPSVTTKLTLSDSNPGSEFIGTYTVKTGRAQFIINKANYRVFDQVSLENNGDDLYDDLDLLNNAASKGIAATDSLLGSVVSYSITPDSIRVKTQNAARIELAFYGKLATPSGTASKYRYKSYMTFYAGKSSVNIELQLYNANPSLEHYNNGSRFFATNSLFIRNGGIELSTQISNGTIEFDTSQGIYTETLSAAQNARLFQDAYHHTNSTSTMLQFPRYRGNTAVGFKVYNGSGTLVSAFSSANSNSTGETALRGTTRSVGAAVLEFAQNNPIGMSAGANGIFSVDMFPNDMARTFPLQPGLGQTHEVALFFGENTDAARDSAQVVVSPTIALASPYWYATSNFFKPFAPRYMDMAASGSFPNPSSIAGFPHANYNTYIDLTLTENTSNLYQGSLARDRATYDMYGKYAYGEITHIHASQRWGQNEYAICYGILLAMIREQDPRWYKYGFNMTRMMGDIAQSKWEGYNENLVGRWWVSGSNQMHPLASENKMSDGRIPNGYWGQDDHAIPFLYPYWYYITGKYSFRDKAIIMLNNSKRRIKPTIASDNNPHINDGYSDFVDDRARAHAWMTFGVIEGWRLLGSAGYKTKVETVINNFNGETKIYVIDPDNLTGWTVGNLSRETNKDYLPANHFGWVAAAHSMWVEEQNWIGQALPANIDKSAKNWATFLANETWVSDVRFNNGAAQPSGSYSKYWNWASASVGSPLTESVAIGNPNSDGIAWAYIAGEITSTEISNLSEMFESMALRPVEGAQIVRDNKSLSYQLTWSGATEAAILGWNRSIDSPSYSLPGPVVDTTSPIFLSVDDNNSITVIAIFNENIDTLTGMVNSNYSLAPTSTFPSGTITINSAIVSGATVTLTLASALSSQIGYTLEIQNVKDIAGNAMVTTQKTFTSNDYSAPTITSLTNPGVNTIVVIFNEAIKASTVSTATWTVDNGITVTNKSMASSNTVNLSVSTLTPTVTYTVTVTGLQDINNNATSNENNSFVAIEPPVTDITAPSFSTVTVDNTTQITVVFDEDIDLTTAENENNWWVVLPGSGTFTGGMPDWTGDRMNKVLDMTTGTYLIPRNFTGYTGWEFPSPHEVDWNNDGAYDLIVGYNIQQPDSLMAVVYINQGTSTVPQFSGAAHADSCFFLKMKYPGESVARNYRSRALPMNGHPHNYLSIEVNPFDFTGDGLFDILLGEPNYFPNMGSNRQGHWFLVNTGSPGSPIFEAVFILGSSVNNGFERLPNTDYKPAIDLFLSIPGNVTGDHPTVNFIDWNHDNIKDIVYNTNWAAVIYGDTTVTGKWKPATPVQWVQENYVIQGGDWGGFGRVADMATFDFDVDGKKELLVADSQFTNGLMSDPTYGYINLYIDATSDGFPNKYKRDIARIYTLNGGNDFNGSINGWWHPRVHILDWDNDSDPDVLLGWGGGNGQPPTQLGQRMFLIKTTGGSINIVNPSSAVRGPANTVILTFIDPFNSGILFDLVADNIQDLSGNATNNLTANLQSLDIASPTISSASSTSETNFRVIFSEVVDQTSAENTSNYSIFINEFGNGIVDAVINSISRVDDITYDLNVNKLWTGTDYKFIINAVEDLTANSSPDTVIVLSFIPNNTAKLELVNNSNRKKTGLTKTLIPFGTNSGPRNLTTSFSLTEYSLEDPKGVPLIAEFRPTALDTVGNLVTELLVVTDITLPANSDSLLFFKWGRTTPNVPILQGVVTVRNWIFGSQVGNGKILYEVAKGSTSPAKDLRFDNTFEPVIRESLYRINIGGQITLSTAKPLSVSVSKDGYLWKEHISSSTIAGLQLDYHIDVFANKKFIEILTTITNSTGSSILINEFELLLPAPWPWSDNYYAPNNVVTGFIADSSAGLRIKQTSSNYTIFKNGIQTNNVQGNYAGWIGSLSRTRNWYIAIVPDNINQAIPRTIERDTNGFHDYFINTPTVINNGDSRSWITVIIIDHKPFNSTLLDEISANISDRIEFIPTEEFLNSQGISKETDEDFIKIHNKITADSGQ